MVGTPHRVMQIAWVALAAAAGAMLASPEDVLGQRWEVGLAGVWIDHDPAPFVDETGEQIPAGLGLSLRRSLTGGFFVGADWSGGTETRPGAVCGSFVRPGSCITEPVAYSGGGLSVNAGWAVTVQIAPWLRAALRPRGGLAVLRARESGLLTGRSYSEYKLAPLLGITGDVGMRPFGPIWIAGSLGIDWLWPVSVPCEDCRKILRERLPRYTAGFGVRWGAVP